MSKNRTVYCLSSDKTRKMDVDKVESKQQKRASKGVIETPEIVKKFKWDPIVDLFRKGCNGENLKKNDFDPNVHLGPVVFRGIAKKTLIWKLQEIKRNFYFIETGYLGNHIYSENPTGKKMWHRITKNDLQMVNQKPRPADRWERLKLSPYPWKKDGRKILVCPPSQKTMNVYHMDLDQWMHDTVALIKAHTDRPIEIRLKAGRSERVGHNTIEQALMADVFAMVTFNSIAACESVFFGIPVFVGGPSAAGPVALNDLSKLETPLYAENRHEWLCNLAYGQFNTDEMIDGTAWRILND